MAYNLQSLIQILEQILHPDQQHFVFDHETTTQLASLLEKVALLKASLENHTPATITRIENLESQITDAAYRAEDIIECDVASQILFKPYLKSRSGTKIVRKEQRIKLRLFRERILQFSKTVHKRRPILGKKFLNSRLELKKVTDEVDSAIDKVMKITGQVANNSFSGASFSPSPNFSNFVVGLDEDLLQLKERLTGSQAQLEFISIVGMGGIGKTTLARHLYNDPLIVYHFDLLAWVTISHEYNVREILECLVGSVTGKDTDGLHKIKIHQLGDILYKSLCGKRYLVVLDDVWSLNVWDEIHMYFPNNKNRSRIVITTRGLNVTNYAGLFNQHHRMNLLNEFQSWNLLCKKVFGDGNFPPAFEKIGRIIARNCRGLPLAIQVIGGVLSKAPKREGFWEQVRNDVSLIVARDDQQFSKILSLSYDHLPHHLRPCLLYLGAFTEDQEIGASRLVRLWAAEGFLQPIAEKSLEEAAEMYLKELVERNLLFVNRKKLNGKVKTYVIHDMLRDLCRRKANAEKFTESNWPGVRRVDVHRWPLFNDHCPFEVMPIPCLRSFLCFEREFCRSRYVHILNELKLVRVLDIFEVTFERFPEEILKLVNVRYLALTLQAELPSALSRLWNLQTLILRGFEFALDLPFRIAVGILGLPCIRHVKAKGFSYLRTKGYIKDLIFESLQTLSLVSATEFGDREFTERIRNIRKLGIDCANFEVVDLSRLHKLESLKCASLDNSHSAIFLSCLTFSPSIKKLTLYSCRLPSMFMATVGSLPNLEELKLRDCSFVNEDMEKIKKWEPNEEGFLSLQFLLLEELKLVCWQANETRFPILRRLVIRKCSKLEEIPRGIGEIPALEMIELYDSPLAVASARQILEEQRDLGNEGLQVLIHESLIYSLSADLSSD